MIDDIKRLFHKALGDGAIIPDTVFEILNEYQTAAQNKRSVWLEERGMREGDVLQDHEHEEYIPSDLGGKIYLPSDIQNKVIS